MTAPASVPALRIFAGTTEGRLLCEWASGAGIPARAYAATEYGGELLGELPGIEVHAGRLDDADMERELSGARIVVDATHPFATLASDNIRAASLAVGARCLRLARPVEALPKGIVPVASIACAARFLSENPGRVLLTTGSKELAPYTRVADFAERFFVRVLPLPGAITKCIDAGFSPSHVIGMQGPFTRELNEAMLRQVGAQWLVIKDSGTVGGTAEKLAAARAVGARCIVVTRPAEGGGTLSLREVEDALLREEDRPEQARPVQARHPPVARGRRPELAQTALQ
ncbi:precorrin-6A reductase [Collinsella sp. OF03-4AA]|nr:precorrin-6A reductase [Collinsella sp. OF03-4AA]